MKKIHLYTLSFFLGLFTFVKSQDIHFSQYNGSVLNMSPAFTGFFDGDYRMGAIYRSQWSSVPVPYRTFSIAADTRFNPKQLKSDCIGAGLMFNNDISGDAAYTINQFYLSGSFIHKVTKDSTLLVSAGISFGINSLGFNYNKMSFDNQYDGYAYNSSLGTGENFAQTKTLYVDFNIGLAAQYSFSQFTKLVYGFSYNHFANPTITYQNNATSKLDSKSVNFLSFSTPINKNLYVIPELIYSHQGKYNEFVPGANVKYVFDSDKNHSASLGIYYRAGDAMIGRIGYTFKTTTAGISYDINTSKFTAATNRRGAFEIYVTHIIKRVRVFVPKKRVCPVFM